MYILKCKSSYSSEGIITQICVPHIHPGLLTHTRGGSAHQPEPTPKWPMGCVFTAQVLTQNAGHDYPILTSQNDSTRGSQAGMLQFEALLRWPTTNPILLTIFEDKKQNLKQMLHDLTF